MLLFINRRREQLLAEWKFQYITCYSLSKFPYTGKRKRHAFQYITCYSLSGRHVTLSGVAILFQYITCYSLSDNTDFNLVSEKRFNTSHVTLYRCKTCTYSCPAHVSIHHMLLFIPRFIGILSIHMSNNTPKPKEFQYFYQALLEILYF